ncbi:MAG: hypothetical protein JXN60_00780 [Lentisphaerae bacterium]|nr:hypothetical protein [Lentisphaerota bacterium]
MATDFSDGDLARSSRSFGKSKEKEGEKVRSDGVVGQMARQKEEMVGQMSHAASEIEELRLRQEMLERERSRLEETARKQRNYEDGRKEMREKIRQSITEIEKEEIQATRMAELLSIMTARLKDTLAELDAINEDSWTDENFNIELDKALVLVDDARKVHKKALARIEAASWHKTVSVNRSGVSTDESGLQYIRRGFGSWLYMGFAVSLPIMLFFAVLFVLWMFFQGALPW